MTNLTEYDREIVAAAERFVDADQAYKDDPGDTDVHFEFTRAEDYLRLTVKTKQDAQRPRCNETTGVTPGVLCRAPAVQELFDHSGQFYRCQDHRIEVSEL